MLSYTGDHGYNKVSAVDPINVRSQMSKKSISSSGTTPRKIKLDPVKTTAKQNWHFERRTLVVDISYYFSDKQELSFHVEAP